MSTVKRFWVKANFGNWSVIDRTDGKMVVGYGKKGDAEATADGLNRIRKAENISTMKQVLKKKGYGHYLRIAKK
jgi:hypothetical protein